MRLPHHASPDARSAHSLLTRTALLAVLVGLLVPATPGRGLERCHRGTRGGGAQRSTGRGPKASAIAAPAICDQIAASCCGDANRTRQAGCDFQPLACLPRRVQRTAAGLHTEVRLSGGQSPRYRADRDVWLNRGPPA